MLCLISYFPFYVHLNGLFPAYKPVACLWYIHIFTQTECIFKFYSEDGMVDCSYMFFYLKYQNNSVTDWQLLVNYNYTGRRWEWLKCWWGQQHYKQIPTSDLDMLDWITVQQKLWCVTVARARQHYNPNYACNIKFTSRLSLYLIHWWSVMDIFYGGKPQLLEHQQCLVHVNYIRTILWEATTMIITLFLKLYLFYLQMFFSRSKGHNR